MQTTLRVIGMSCMGCVGSVKRALETVPGVERVDVSLERNEALVEFNPQTANVDALKSAVAAAGYDVP